MPNQGQSRALLQAPGLKERRWLMYFFPEIDQYLPHEKEALFGVDNKWPWGAFLASHGHPSKASKLIETVNYSV